MKRKKSQAGQATVELLLSLFVFMTVFFMFVQVAMSLATANYIQYATFIAARAHLAAFYEKDQQKEAATSYLTKMLGGGGNRFQAIAKPEGGGDFPGAKIGPASAVKLAPNTEARSTAWEQGVTYTFKVKLFMAPMVPGVGSGEDAKVTLESQSWLGREPTAKECETQMATRGARMNAGILYFDNGC